MQLADSQERHAQLDERVIDAERKLSESRAAAAQHWSARPRKPQFAQRSAGGGASAELSTRHRDRQPSRPQTIATGRAACRMKS